MESFFITKLIKVGTSQGIVIPREILDAYKWERGDVLVFGFAGTEQLLVKRVSDVEIQKLKPQHEIS